MTDRNIPDLLIISTALFAFRNEIIKREISRIRVSFEMPVDVYLYSKTLDPRESFPTHLIRSLALMVHDGVVASVRNEVFGQRLIPV